jgi:hypothetical protein
METGRFEGVGIEDIICPFCNDTSVENEVHYVFNCRVYDDLRVDLYSRAKEHDSLFSEFKILINVRTCFPIKIKNNKISCQNLQKYFR